MKDRQFHILIIDDVAPILLEKLASANIACTQHEGMSAEEVHACIGNYDGIIMRSKVIADKELIDKGVNLKLIGRSPGMETIDVQYAESKGIACFNSPEGNCDALAEHALGMLLALANNLCKADAQVRSKIWKREENRGFEIKGKTIGLIGYGFMGQAFAKRLCGFGVNILAHDKYKSGFGCENVTESSLEEIQKQADIISFHLPQTKETIGYCTEVFFNSFAKPIVIINTSRGKVLPLDNLHKAMQEGRVRGACLDVLEYENYNFEKFFSDNMPPAWEYLSSSPNVVLARMLQAGA